MPGLRPQTFVDRGGTFTDVVTIDARGGVTIRKVPSDWARIGDLADGRLTFGTTVATNAILERRVAPTLLLVSRGLADLVLGPCQPQQVFRKGRRIDIGRQRFGRVAFGIHRDQQRLELGAIFRAETIKRRRHHLQ